MSFDSDWTCPCEHGIDTHVGQIGQRCTVPGCRCDLRPSQVARAVVRHARADIAAGDSTGGCGSAELARTCRHA